MTRRDPFREIEDLLERMGREFEELGGSLDAPGPSDTPDFLGARNVPVDVLEDDDAITVLADLPGFEDDDIEVELREDALTIAATREEANEVAIDGDSDEDANRDESDVRYHRRERRRRSVSRRISLPEPVERDGASASYDGGVLTVTLPKRSANDSAGHSIDVN
ncbi:Hsp20/alpha crystallin family protein [Halorubrum trueperi]|uniref:Hsp20/alpha crystallin family protein n=1 Tax=Halorubrum trueperi TaxID=2004704 RepID=A0ABD5UIM5_9EURY